MNSNSINNKKIFSNATFMLFRSVFTLLIGLYSSRVLLEKLGVEDYGVYTVVGSIVAMFNSLRTFFSSSIQRYLNYSKGDVEKLNKIFNVGVEIQIILCVVFFIILEVVGMIMVPNLNIPTDRMQDAFYIFQISLLTALVSMLTVPYDALIIAKERMSAFAGFSILESSLRLIIVFMISVGPYSHVLNYAILAFFVAVLMRIINTLYCKHLFPEAKMKFVKDYTLIKEMGSFAGWNFLGNTGYSLTHQGINFVLNLFGGTTINTARSLAYQILEALKSLLGNVNIAFKPQTVSLAANKDKSAFYSLLLLNAKTNSCFYLLIVIPCVIFIQPAIMMWLGFIPNYLVSFVLAVSVYHWIRTIHVPIDMFFISIGEMKDYQRLEIIFLGLNVPFAYLLLYLGLPYWTVFLGMSFIEILNHIGILIIAVKKFDFPLMLFFRKMYIPFFSMSLFSLFIVIVIKMLFDIENLNIFYDIYLFLIIEIMLCSFIVYSSFDAKERGYAFSKLVQLLKRH